MGYVFDFNATKAYETWCDQPPCRSAIDRELRLMFELLNPMRGRRVLDIGCGHGIALKALLDAGLDVTGLDPSPYMLDAAGARLGHRADFQRGVAEDLPFEDNTFHYACLVKTLEFVDAPEKALEEVFRVTKDRVYIGLVNRHAFHIRENESGDPAAPFSVHTRFIGLRRLKHMIRHLAGNVPVDCRVLQCRPRPSGKIVEKLIRLPLLQRMPVGMYFGVVVTLNPRLRTRPLTITYAAKAPMP